MGGEIAVESREGVGTTFIVRLTLPVSEENFEPVDESFDLSERRVLIVDDLDINRNILTEQLSAWGMDTLAVEGGKDALTMLDSAITKGETIDVAILDYHMPEMDGAELARRIKADTRFASVKLVVLSSGDGEGNLQEFREAGVDAYPSKPAKSQTLRRTLANVLVGPQAAEAPNPSATNASPRATAPGASPNAPASEETAARAVIMVAEDNETNRLVVNSMIQRTDREILFAVDGREAYNLYRARDIDIVLMDVSIPDMDGVEATKAIRAFEVANNRKQTPIVCLTAHALAEDRDRFLACGMNDYLAKPVKKADLEACLEKYLQSESETTRATA